MSGCRHTASGAGFPLLLPSPIMAADRFARRPMHLIEHRDDLASPLVRSVTRTVLFEFWPATVR